MAKVQIKAVEPFSHGRITAHPGDVFTINDEDAKGLVGAGLAEVVADADEDAIDDLVGSKMSPMTSNKMEAKPANKADKADKK